MADPASGQKKSPRFRGAWFIFGITVVLNMIAIALIIVNPFIPIAQTYGIRGIFTFASISLGFLGILIVSRYPDNRIGWIFNAFGLPVAILALIQEYANYAIFARPELAAGGVLAAWVLNWIWVIISPLPILLFLLFPNGKLPSPRWRLLIWLSVANVIPRGITVALTPGPLTSMASIDNPFGLENSSVLFEAALILTAAINVAALLSAAISLVLRYRRARASERQQIKWVLYAVVLFVLTSPASTLDFPWHLLPIVAFVFLLVTVVIAIFRYRLYDIDIIIRRTLVYSILTGLMVLVYFGSVLLFQYLLRTLSGVGSQLSVVASTLTIAALFNPLRHRVQDVIDRRLYRRKYDAEKTLAAFAVTVQGEVNTDRLAEALLAVVEETVQPAEVSLWQLEPDRQAPKWDNSP